MAIFNLPNIEGAWTLNETTSDQVYERTFLTNNTILTGDIVITHTITASEYSLSSSSNSGAQPLNDINPGTSDQYVNITKGWTPKSYIKINKARTGVYSFPTNTVVGSNITRSTSGTTVTFSGTISPGITVSTAGWISSISGSFSASMSITESTLIAGNIKKDVTIFGVTGTYVGADIPTYGGDYSLS